MNKDQLRYKKMRDQVVLQLGGVCHTCGFKDPRALQIDHINGGGNDDRRKFGGRWRLFYEYVMDNPMKFQILCSNCNSIKRIEKSEHRVAGPKTLPTYLDLALGTVNGAGLLNELSAPAASTEDT